MDLRSSSMLLRAVRGIAVAVLVIGLAGTSSAARPRAASAQGTSANLRVGHVVDGDTIDLGNGARVRLVQIDTPEVYFRPECYGRQASSATKRLLPHGTPVRLLPEPVTDRVDQYGRLLGYVIRARDGLNVNVRLVAIGAAAPYFYAHRRGRYATRLEALARRARARSQARPLGPLSGNAVRPVSLGRDRPSPVAVQRRLAASRLGGFGARG